MQSSAPYLEGDYYATDETKVSEKEPELNSENRENKDIIDEESLTEQLHKTEEEIITLRQVLNVKLKLAQDLKRQLGITAINEMKGDIIHSLNSIKESNTYKATTDAMKNVKEKTTSTISTASSKLSQKLGMLRKTNTIKSIEDKMGSAYSSVKKVPCKYNPGDKIFAKVKGFVYWPARVNPLPEDIVIPPNKIPIFFYGTHEVFFISPTSCWPYDEKNKSKWGKQRPRAYFNQGIDEIENYSTIYQYGVDPLAEEFLSQFYQFKKSNGQNSVPKKFNKIQPNSESEDADGTINEGVKKKPSSEKESKKQTSTKKRNKSGSSVSLKDNKTDSKSVSEYGGNELESKIETDQTSQTRKRRISESELSAKENNNLESNVIDIETTPKDQGVSLRKRQKSGISELNAISTTPKVSKTPDNRRKLKRYSTKVAPKNENSISINEQKDYTDEIKLKLDISEIVKAEIVLEEANKLEKIVVENSTIVDQTVKTEVTEENETGPTTRHRMKSSSTKQSMASVATGKNSDIDSKSPSVDSDNLADEDFRPAVKPRSSPKKTRISRSTSKSATKKASAKPRRTSTAVKAVTKRKSNVKIEANDSLSSISSDEKETVTEPLEKEPVKKVIDISQILREPVDKEKEKLNLVPPTNDNKSQIFVTPNDDVKVPEVPVSSQDDDVCKMEKEVVVNICKTDIHGDNSEVTNNAEFHTEAPSEHLADPWISISSPLEDLKLTFTNKNRSRKTKIVSQSDKEDRVVPHDIIMEVVEEPPEVEQKSDITIIKESLDEKEREVSVPVDEEDQPKDMEPEIKTDEVTEQDSQKVPSVKIGSKKSSINIVIESDDDDDKSKSVSPTKSIDNIERMRKMKFSSLNTREMKPSKSSSKKQKQTASRKRNRKLSSSSGSDIEITKHEHMSNKQQALKRARLADRSSGSDDNSKSEMKSPNKSSADRVQLLHNYNADIRSSLILGHEDYKTCLARFRSLCEMSIDLVSLIKVWQLMDTVKKCRRYKRNEEVKQEAQAVYKRFMSIYSRASKDEINASQALLMQYRHQNNIQNQNVGGDANKNSTNIGTSGNTSGGSQQTAQMPISVADMFQNNRGSGNSESQVQRQRVAETVNKPSAEERAPEQATEDEINEEKMRLLSADLEAKVSDILNKIEKNVDTNPINQRSLSHLLPAESDVTPSIKLPLQWQCVDRPTRDRVRDRERKMGLGDHQALSDDDLVDIGDIGDDDEDDDDVEAIVRRIEEVAIRLNGQSGPVSTTTGLASTVHGIISDHDDGSMATSDMSMAGSSHHHSSGGGGSSALDARIENLINNSFISSSSSAVPINSSGSGKESRQSRRSSRASQPHRSGGVGKSHHHHHHHSRNNNHNNNNNNNNSDSNNSNGSTAATSNHVASTSTTVAITSAGISTSPPLRTNQALFSSTLISNSISSLSNSANIHKSEPISQPSAAVTSFSVTESRKLTPPTSTLSPSPSQQLSASLDSGVEQKDDIEIYDLLGV